MYVHSPHQRYARVCRYWYNNLLGKSSKLRYWCADFWKDIGNFEGSLCSSFVNERFCTDTQSPKISGWNTTSRRSCNIIKTTDFYKSVHTTNFFGQKGNEKISKNSCSHSICNIANGDGTKKTTSIEALRSSSPVPPNEEEKSPKRSSNRVSNNREKIQWFVIETNESIFRRCGASDANRLSKYTEAVIPLYCCSSCNSCAVAGSGRQIGCSSRNTLYSINCTTRSSNRSESRSVFASSCCSGGSGFSRFFNSSSGQSNNGKSRDKNTFKKISSSRRSSDNEQPGETKKTGFQRGRRFQLLKAMQNLMNFNDRRKAGEDALTLEKAARHEYRGDLKGPSPSGTATQSGQTSVAVQHERRHLQFEQQQATQNQRHLRIKDQQQQQQQQHPPTEALPIEATEELKDDSSHWLCVAAAKAAAAAKKKLHYGRGGIRGRDADLLNAYETSPVKYLSSCFPVELYNGELRKKEACAETHELSPVTIIFAYASLGDEALGAAQKTFMVTLLHHLFSTRHSLVKEQVAAGGAFDAAAVTTAAEEEVEQPGRASVAPFCYHAVDVSEQPRLESFLGVSSVPALLCFHKRKLFSTLSPVTAALEILRFVREASFLAEDSFSSFFSSSLSNRFFLSAAELTSAFTVATAAATGRAEAVKGCKSGATLGFPFAACFSGRQIENNIPIGTAAAKLWNSGPSAEVMFLKAKETAAAGQPRDDVRKLLAQVASVSPEWARLSTPYRFFSELQFLLSDGQSLSFQKRTAVKALLAKILGHSSRDNEPQLKAAQKETETARERRPGSFFAIENEESRKEGLETTQLDYVKEGTQRDRTTSAAEDEEEEVKKILRFREKDSNEQTSFSCGMGDLENNEQYGRLVARATVALFDDCRISSELLDRLLSKATSSLRISDSELLSSSSFLISGEEPLHPAEDFVQLRSLLPQKPETASAELDMAPPTPSQLFSRLLRVTAARLFSQNLLKYSESRLPAQTDFTHLPLSQQRTETTSSFAREKIRTALLLAAKAYFLETPTTSQRTSHSLHGIAVTAAAPTHSKTVHAQLSISTHSALTAASTTTSTPIATTMSSAVAPASSASSLTASSASQPLTGSACALRLSSNGNLEKFKERQNERPFLLAKLPTSSSIEQSLFDRMHCERLPSPSRTLLMAMYSALGPRDELARRSRAELDVQLGTHEFTPTRFPLAHRRAGGKPIMMRGKSGKWHWLGPDWKPPWAPPNHKRWPTGPETWAWTNATR